MAGPTEQEKAELSQKRGQLAANIKDPEERKKFIAEQGDVDKSGGKEGSYAQLYQKTSGEETAQATRSYKKGGIVKKTGPALVHKGERVIPAPHAHHAHPVTKVFPRKR